MLKCYTTVIQMIKNIIFDLGNVLIPLDFDRTQNALISLLKNPTEGGPLVMQLVKRYEVGEISTPIFINGFLRLSHTNTQAVDVVRAWNSIFLDIPQESIDLLQELRQNYSVFILSNTNELHIDYVNRQLQRKYGVEDLNDLVDKAYYSHDMKLAKPDNRIYLNLLESANIKAEESVFIDDLKENIVAAIDRGLHGIHLEKFAEAGKLLKEFLSEQK